MAITYLDETPKISAPKISKIEFLDEMPSDTPSGYPSPRALDNPPAGAEVPAEQRLLENIIGATSGYTLPGAVSALKSGLTNALNKSGSPLLRGLINSPKELSPEFQAGKEAVGIGTDLPERIGRKARFPEPELNVATKQPKPIAKAETLPGVSPVAYPKDTNAFLNFANARVKAFGNKLSPQELNDFKEITGEMFRKGEIVPGTDQYAVATKLQHQVTPLLNKAIPGRASLNKTYAISKTLHPNVIGAVKDYAKTYGPAALFSAIGLKALFGGNGVGK
jgi:hypothetical protein